MKDRRLLSAVAVTLVLSLAGCGSVGGLGSILGGVLGGGGTGSNYPSNQSQTVRGTVTYVDSRAQRIDLTTSGRQTVSISYDSRTRVSYGNQTTSPQNLERGDEIEVRVYDGGNGRYTAESIDVLRSVSDNGNRNSYPNGGSNYPNNSRGSDIQGTVSYVDTRNQTLELNVSYINGSRTSRSNVVVRYDNNTRVYYQNNSYRPSDLERGDQVEIRASDSGRGEYFADNITVTRSVRN